MAVRRWISTSDNDFTTAANWSGGTAPVTGDTIIFDGTGTAAMTAGLNQSAVTGVTLIVTHAHSAAIGSDSAGVATYFQIGASSVVIGRDDGGTGSGSPLVLLDFGSTANATNVIQTASSSANAKYPPVCVKGSAVTLTASGGKVGVAVRPGETSSGLTVKTTKGLTGASPSIYLGAGVTATLITIDNGTVQTLSDNTSTAVRVSGGRYVNYGAGAHTLLNVDEGTALYLGAGTITAANVRGTLDFSADARSKTVTDCSVYKGGTLNVDNGVPGGVVFTNPIQYPDGLSAVVVTTPAGVKGTLTNI